MTITATVSDAAVQAAIDAFWMENKTEESKMIAALTAALPHLALSSAPCSVEVKKLEWVDYYATTEFGAYTVGDDDHGWFFTFHEYPYGDADEARFDLIDEAKAAAKADFDRRILSQIVTKPVNVAAVWNDAVEQSAVIADSCHMLTPDVGNAVRNLKKRALSPAEPIKCPTCDKSHTDLLPEVSNMVPHAEPAQAEQTPQDVIDLVIAGRDVVYGGHINVVGKEFDVLDKALEAFAGRIDWDDEPDSTTEGGEV